MGRRRLLACERLAASWPECLNMLVSETRSGGTTDHIDRLAFEFAIDTGLCPRR
jgi:hypothetical protein